MPKIRPKFTGKIDGKKLEKGKEVQLPAETVAKLNPNGYTTRPVKTKTRPLQADKSKENDKTKSDK